MKKQFSLFALCLFLCLPTGCTNSSIPPAKSDTPPETAVATAEQKVSPVYTADPQPERISLRIVSGAESGELILAEIGKANSGIYTLNTQMLPKDVLPQEPLQDGQLINICYGAFSEAWPMRFGGVTSIEMTDSAVDNRAALYLCVLEDLWNKDRGLNEGVEMIGVDLSQTSLSLAEQSAVAWAFAENHGAALVEGPLEDLINQGYISATPISTSGSGTDLPHAEHYFYHWENGCHFSITEPSGNPTSTSAPSLFDAQKWRSSLGSYFFSDCQLIPAETGDWAEYHIGSEMIS